MVIYEILNKIYFLLIIIMTWLDSESTLRWNKIFFFQTSICCCSYLISFFLKIYFFRSNYFLAFFLFYFCRGWGLQGLTCDSKWWAKIRLHQNFERKKSWKKEWCFFHLSLTFVFCGFSEPNSWRWWWGHDLGFWLSCEFLNHFNLICFKYCFFNDIHIYKFILL
jgi:hypothetical protein